MNPIRRIIVSLLMGCLLNSTSAQCSRPSAVHNELWTRLYINHNFSAKLRLESEYQFRWQNNLSNGTSLPSYKLAQGTRVWLYYKHNTHFTAAISPFCWFRTYPLINVAADFSKTYTNELRASAGGEIKYPVGAIEFKGRIIYETRFFSAQCSNTWSRKDRVRARALLSIPLLSKDSAVTILSVFAGNEYFFQGEKAFTTNSLFEQNRLIGGFSWNVNNHVRFDAYYMHILKTGTTGKFIERVIWLNTSITL